MIARDEQGRLELLPLGRFAGEAGVEIESIIRLAAAARAAGPLTDPANVIALVQLTIELDEVYLPVNSKGWRKEQVSWFSELEHRGVSPVVLDFLRRGAGNVEVARRAKRALGAMLWIEGVPRQESENLLMRHHRENAVAGAVQGTVNRTIDLLPSALQVIELISGESVEELQAELLLRLQLGIPAELADLGVLYADRLTRTQYLALRDAGIQSPSDLDAAGDEHLSEVLGIEADRLAVLLEP